MKRNSHLIKAKKRVKFDSKRVTLPCWFSQQLLEKLLCLQAFLLQRSKIPCGFKDWTHVLSGREGNLSLNKILEGKRYPERPECEFKVVSVPCFCRYSESGIITSQLLAAMLKLMDQLNLFDWSNVFHHSCSLMALKADLSNLFSNT
jgi:hypothetical protein